MTTLTVDTDGTSGTYSSLATAAAALPATVTDDYTISCDATTGAADVLATTLTFANDTTADHRLYIIGTAKYKVQVADTVNVTVALGSAAYANYTFTLAFEKTSASASSQLCLYLNTMRYGELRVLGCSFLGPSTTYYDNLLQVRRTDAYTCTAVVANCTFRGRSTSTNTASVPLRITYDLTVSVYNNTFISRKPWQCPATQDNIVMLNNVVKTTVNGDAVDNLSNYNCFSGDFDSGGANDQRNQTFTFADETNFNYDLSESDTGARGHPIDVGRWRV
jgi:hypothetical protein